MKYELPEFLKISATQEAYDKWLSRKASAHLKRDRKRGNIASTREQYKIEIHQAVVRSNGFDEYTGKSLRWNLISTYDNDISKNKGREYKATFADLPTVDHVNDGKGDPDFKICSWKVNDAKNDLSLEEFLDLCETVLRHNTESN